MMIWLLSLLFVAFLCSAKETESEKQWNVCVSLKVTKQNYSTVSNKLHETFGKVQLWKVENDNNLDFDINVRSELTYSCCTNPSKVPNNFNKHNYYWRDFDGTIPADAVPGGTDTNNRTTYIGNTMFPQHQALLPTIIYEGDIFAHSHLGPFYLKSHKNTKILCAAPDSQPIWKKVKFNEVHNECTFIIGGYHNAMLRIGRKKFDNIYITGKVYPADHEWYGFEVWQKGHIGHIEEYELLGYC